MMYGTPVFTAVEAITHPARRTWLVASPGPASTAHRTRHTAVIALAGIDTLLATRRSCGRTCSATEKKRKEGA